MAQDLGTGYILIQPSTKGLGKAIEDPLNTAVQSASKSGGKTILSRIGGAFTSVGKVGLAAIGTIGGGLAALTAKGGFDRALNIERAQTKLKALGHDTQSVDAIMDDALNSVKGTAFGLGDAASVAATLVASGIQSGTQLQTVLGTVGDAAQIAGVGFKDMGVIFSQVAAKGKLQGDEMLQLMQAGIPVLQYLADHYKTTTAEAQEMVSSGKVSFADFEAAMREHIGGAAQSAGESFDGAMGNVRAALSRLGETVATPVINGLTRMANQAIPIIDDFTATAQPALEKIGTAIQNGLENALPALQDLASWISGTLLPSLQDLAGYLPVVETGFSGVAAAIAAIKISQGIVTTISAMKDLNAVLELVSEQTGKGVNVFTAISEAVGALAPKTGSLAAGLGSASKSLGTLFANATKAGGGIMGLSSALKLGPWGLVAAAIAAVAAGLAVFLTQTETGQAMLAEFGAFMSTVWDQVQAAWQAALPVLESLVSGLLQGLLAIVQPMLPSIQQLGTAFAQLGTTLMATFQACLPAIQSVMATLQQALAAILPSIMQFATTVAPLVAQFVATVLPVITQIATLIGSLLVPFITQLATLIAGFLPTMATLASTLVGMLLPVITGIVNVVTALLPVVTTVVNTIAAVVNPIITAIGGAIQGLIGILQGGITFLTGVFTGNWSQAWQGIQQVFNGVWQAIQSVFTGIWEAIKAAISGGLSIIGNLWNSAWSGIRSAFDSIWNGIKTAASNGVNAVVNVVKGVKDKITGFFSSAGSWLMDAGANIIQGLIGGITGAVGGAIDAVKNAVGGIIDGAKSLLGIHSPSTVFRDEIGRMIGEGLAIGIQRETGTVSKAGSELATASMPASIPLPVFDTAAWSASIRRTVASMTIDLAAGRSDAKSAGDAGNNDIVTLLRAILAAIADADTTIQLDGREVGRLVRRYANA